MGLPTMAVHVLLITIAGDVIEIGVCLILVMFSCSSILLHKLDNTIVDEYIKTQLLSYYTIHEYFPSPQN